MHVRDTATWPPIFLSMNHAVFSIFHHFFWFPCPKHLQNLCFLPRCLPLTPTTSRCELESRKKMDGNFFSAQKIQTFCALKKVTSESQIFFAFYRGFYFSQSIRSCELGSRKIMDGTFFSAQKILPFCGEKKTFESFGSMVACFFFLSISIWHFIIKLKIKFGIFPDGIGAHRLVSRNVR